MTKEERRLWYDFLKALPVTVNRQKVIGPYIVDFCCYEARLIIELDGSQHFEPNAINADWSSRSACSAGLTGDIILPFRVEPAALGFAAI